MEIIGWIGMVWCLGICLALIFYGECGREWEALEWLGAFAWPITALVALIAWASYAAFAIWGAVADMSREISARGYRAWFWERWR